jgi:hypothetical protein
MDQNTTELLSVANGMHGQARPPAFVLNPTLAIEPIAALPKKESRLFLSGFLFERKSHIDRV